MIRRRNYEINNPVERHDGWRQRHLPDHCRWWEAGGEMGDGRKGGDGRWGNGGEMGNEGEVGWGRWWGWEGGRKYMCERRRLVKWRKVGRVSLGRDKKDWWREVEGDYEEVWERLCVREAVGEAMRQAVGEAPGWENSRKIKFTVELKKIILSRKGHTIKKILEMIRKTDNMK